MTVGRLGRIAGHRLRSLLQKGTMDAQLEQEFAFHYEQLLQENLAEGMALEHARNAARRMLGNTGVLSEQCRDERRVNWLYDFWQDARYGARLLRHTPAWMLVAVSSLAIGIGGNTAILSLADRVVLGKLPYPNAEQLVVLRTFPANNPQQSTNASVPDYMAWKEQTQSFQAMGASLSDQQDFGLEEDGTPAERVTGQGSTPALFATLGVPPLLGRVFTEEEDEIENPAPLIVLSHQLWQHRFGGDPHILNRPVRLNGRSLTVIGVMPPDFQFPSETTQYWVPLSLNRQQLQGSARFFMVTARLKPGTTAAQAQSELDAIAAQLAHDSPERHRGWRVRVQSLREYWFGWTREPLLMLECAVVLVLLIACANVATLLLARGSVRRAEFAMRLALGAGPWRIMRQVLTESVVLSLLGGAAGLLVAGLGLRAVPNFNPNPSGLHLGTIGLSLRTFVATGIVSVLTGLAFGVIPALAGFALTGVVRGAGMRSSRQRLRGALVSIQVSIALVLLISAGLLARSFAGLVGAERNFDARGVLTFELRVPLQQFLRSRGAYRGMPSADVNPPTAVMERVYERLQRLPGIVSVAGISFHPINSLVLPTMSLLIEGRPLPRNEADRSAMSAVYFLATPNLFATMRTPFVRGRDFDSRDSAAAPWVAVINESAARRFWPGDDAIGKRITLEAAEGEQPREVVGIVRDVPVRYNDPMGEPVVYVSYLQQPVLYRGLLGNMFGQMTFLVRAPGDPMSLASAARRAVAEIDPDRPLANMQPWEQAFGRVVRDRGYYALILSAFGLTATLLAALGIYGVMAYTVTQRTREIGVRMALGATAHEIVRLVSGQSFALIASGLALGLLGAAILTRLLSSQLWGVTATDPVTFAGVSVLLAVIAVCACLFPVRRAIRVDPTEALRSE